MGLLNELKNLIVEKPTKWYDVALASTDMDDIYDILRINFSNNYEAMFNVLEKKGLGRKFLNRITHYWDEPDLDLKILQFLGGPKSYKNGSIDNDLFDEFIVYPAIERMSTVSVADDGKILYELMDGEESMFFSDNAQHIAKMVFSDGFDPDAFDYDAYESIEDLIKVLSKDNYIKLVRFVVINWQNQVVHSRREEFETWVESDGVGDDGFFITPSRLNHYITDDDRYNFIVLLTEVEDFQDLVHQIKYEYNLAWSYVVEGQYYTAYYKALKEYLGDVVKVGTTHTYLSNAKKTEVPTRFYDVTNTIRDIFFKWVAHHGDIDEDELYHLIPGYSDLDPSVSDYPDDDQEVLDGFNENFENALY